MSSIDTLVRNKAAGRVHAKDATLYDFSDEARTFAESFMGWTDLASNPPVALKKIKKIAKRADKDGIEHVVLIGQGGSTQASMTVTKFWNYERPKRTFHTLDSDSPVRLREVLASCDPKKTLVIVSSKSGGTLEMRLMLSALRAEFLACMDEDRLSRHLVAITDPGSPLQARAESEGWSAILPGELSVGGRFSALSVFGLLPAALVGINIKKFVKRAAEAEVRCSENAPDNPAIQLGAFLFDNYQAGRDKFAFVTQKRARVLGLWIEQLVAESTGKQGQGILPYLEVDPLLLARDGGDRTAIVYRAASSADERANFERGLACIHADIPRLDYELESVYDLAEQFVMWEYATAMCGYLMKVCPFDQPDVASAKKRVLGILEAGLPVPDFTADFLEGVNLGQAKAHVSACCAGATDVRGALKGLLSSLKPHDYFAVNAFLPFTGEGRREALESIRASVARRTGAVSCLEVGPRFLHSTGQLQKGGPNTGVFLVLSADEPDDVALVGQPAASLGQLADAQATGDALTLAERGRRCLHLHLPNHSAATLRQLSVVIADILEELARENA